MGTTTEKLQAALDSKNDVKAALEEHGIEVTEDFSTYGSHIRDRLTNKQIMENHIKDVAAHNPIMVNATSSDGVTYTAEIDNLTELYPGLCLTVILDKTSDSKNPTLNVNGLGAKYFRQKLSTNISTTTEGANNTWLVAKKPFSVMYNGTYWVVELARTDANNIYGTVPITAGGTGATTAEAALENLRAASKYDVELLNEAVATLNVELDNYLPLTGGTLSGDLFFSNGYGMVGSDANQMLFITKQTIDDNANSRRLALLNDNSRSLIDSFLLLDVANGNTSIYRIFGEHNKPSGSYTGNGDATVREIITGSSISEFMIVKGNGFITLVTSGVGSISFRTDIGTINCHGDNMYCGDNLLVLKTANEAVNANGKTYEWYIL